MKQIKFSLQSLAFALAVVAAFAFKPAPAAKPEALVEKWFAYIGDPDDPNEQTQASNYELYNGDGSTPACNSTADLCAVQFETDASGMHPLASDVSNISDDPKRRFNP